MIEGLEFLLITGLAVGGIILTISIMIHDKRITKLEEKIKWLI